MWSTASNRRYSISRKMNTHNQKAPNEVHAIGEAAAAILSAAQQGTVLASVTGAVYLQNQHGELCWLVPMDAPMHQRGIKTVGQVSHPRPGTRYQVVGHTLVIDSEKILDFRHAKMWEEPLVSLKGITPVSALSGSLSFIAEQLFGLCNPPGLGCLIDPILQLAIQHENDMSPCFENRIAERAWPEVKGMIQTSLEHDDKLFIQHANSLVGLGEGLTPSGDDFLGGFFYAAHLLQNHFSTIVIPPTCTHSDFVLHWLTLTSWLSYSILLDNIDGHSIEPMHELAAGVLMGSPADRLVYHARRLVSLGHSTGWDMLSGFIAGMSTVIGQPYSTLIS